MVFRNLRKYTKTIMWVIAIMIVPAFVIWNIGSAVKDRRSGFAGKIFNTKISHADFTAQRHAAHNEALMKYGENYPENINLDEQTWTRIIILYKAREAHIKVSNKELAEYIRNLPLFKFADISPDNYPLFVARQIKER